MKINYKWTFYVVILGILVWGFITPSGIRGAWANNVWSTKFVKSYYEDPATLSQFPPAPTTHVHWNLFLIQLAIQNKDYDLAMEYINPLVEASDHLALDAYVTILYLQEDYAKALELWEQIGDIRIIDRAAHDLINKGRQDLSLIGYKKLYEINPEKYTSSYAVILKNLDHYDEASSIFLHSIKEYPNSKEKVNWLRYVADILARQQKWPEAESAYLEALAEDASDFKTWRNLGILYSSGIKDNQKAVESFTRLIELNPDIPYGYYLLGQAYEFLGNKNSAIENYNNALVVDPDYPKVKQALERLSSSN